MDEESGGVVDPLRLALMSKPDVIVIGAGMGGSPRRPSFSNAGSSRWSWNTIIRPAVMSQPSSGGDTSSTVPLMRSQGLIREAF